jgi:hypothetical protein
MQVNEKNVRNACSCAEVQRAGVLPFPPYAGKQCAAVELTAVGYKNK